MFPEEKWKWLSEHALFLPLFEKAKLNLNSFKSLHAFNAEEMFDKFMNLNVDTAIGYTLRPNSHCTATTLPDKTGQSKAEISATKPEYLWWG